MKGPAGLVVRLVLGVVATWAVCGGGLWVIQQVPMSWTPHVSGLIALASLAVLVLKEQGRPPPRRWVVYIGLFAIAGAVAGLPYRPIKSVNPWYATAGAVVGCMCLALCWKVAAELEKSEALDSESGGSASGDQADG